MNITTHTTGFSETVINGAEEGDVGFLLGVYLVPVTAALLSSVTVIIRWNDGIDDRSKIFELLLTSLGGLSSGVFPVYKASQTEVTAEAILVGTGDFALGFGFGSC